MAAPAGIITDGPSKAALEEQLHLLDHVLAAFASGQPVELTQHQIVTMKGVVATMQMLVKATVEEEEEEEEEAEEDPTKAADSGHGR